MNTDIEKLKEKHKEFLKKINAELIKENDFNGNYHRLDDYLSELKDKKVKNKKEKELLLNKIRDDNYAEVAYQDYLDQLDGPRWYLEKTYPIFYSHFKERFEKFIKEWAIAADFEDFNKEFTDDMFLNLCRQISYELEAEINFKEALLTIEKKGLTQTTKKKISLHTSAIDQLIDQILGLPEMILNSLVSSKEKWNKIQKEYIEKKKDKSIFPGNPFSKRGGDKIIKYERVAKIIKILEDDYPYVNGAQKFAGEIEGCNSNSFSKWMNYSTENSIIVLKWRKDVTEPEKNMLKEKIDQKLREIKK